MTANDDRADDDTDQGGFRVTNEFAQVAVRKVSTRNGERLEIRNRESDVAIRLDALELESLTWVDNERFDELFREHLDADEPG